MTERGAARPSARVRRRWPYALALVCVKLAIGAFVLASGFHGVSDDDFARVVIAQRFAEAPSLDPSGTSWLPLPFWIYGATMSVFGSSMYVARTTAAVLGVMSVLVLFEAGRALGLRNRTAFAGAAIAGIFPYSMYLGASTVPEAPAAALTVFGAAALSGGTRLRWRGALALTLATAARYEPWAAAFAFAALSALHAGKARDARLLGPSALALAFPTLWLVHGLVHHGDALFFVARVSAYQSALGLQPTQLGAALARTPLALVTSEPELVLGALCALAASRWLVPRRTGLGTLSAPDVQRTATMLGSAVLAPSPSGGVRLAPFFAVLGAIIVMLVVGDARGSAPTHHAERALLALWFGAALALGAVIDRALEAPFGARASLAAAALSAAFTGALWVRPAFPRDGFAARTSELAIGESARRRGAERLVIDTPDFGYFAVQAAFGSPSRSRALDDHDPRALKRGEPVAEDPHAFVRALAGEGSRWLALPASRAVLFGAEATVRDTHGHFALLELESPLVIERAGPAEAEPIRAGSTQVGR